MNPPDDSPCWDGEWSPVAPMVDFWAQGAMMRTVGCLPSLHPWRLGDDKGARRSLLWCSSPPTADGGVQADSECVAVLTQSAPPPSLPVGDGDDFGDLGTGTLVGGSASLTEGLLGVLATELGRRTADALADRFADTSHDPSTRRDFPELDPGVHRWVGGMAQLPGAWLPKLAILARGHRDFDDPATRWSTESLAFADRHTVHASDMRFASDVLAPHVTALVLDQVPADAAITIAGDAIHVWWEYTEETSRAAAKVRRTVDIASRIREAIPTFVLADYPDHSDRVENRLAERAASAAAYRASRTAGHNVDPTLRRIYAQAQADYEAGLKRP